MNKLLVITVLVALLAINTEGFRVLRQVEEEKGSLTKITDAIKFYYNSAVDTASGYIDTIEEKAMDLYTDTTTVVGTYAGILQDQIYHIVYSQ